MKDFEINNKYGYVGLECYSDGGKGAMICISDNNIKGIPPNHVILNEQELTKLAKWIVGRLNEVDK